MRAERAVYGNRKADIIQGQGVVRRAVGYIRVSTDMQAADGLSLDAQAIHPRPQEHRDQARA